MPAELFPGYDALRDRIEVALDDALGPGGPLAPVDRFGDPVPGPFGEWCPPRLRDAMRHSLLAGGKRLRPVLTLLCHRACGGEREDRAMPVAVAVELVHTYSLIHDDLPCMDDDDLRRGRPTCHVAFDEATAVLAGDALLTLAFRCVGRLPPRLALACLNELADAAGAPGMVGGQVADLAAEADPASVRTGDQLEAVHRRKTAALIRAACGLGAVTAGSLASEDRGNAARLRAYGAHVGLAFQIADDLLDLSADSATLGKTAGKDVAAGKLTYPAFYGEDGARRRAADCVDRAVSHLDAFGDAAAPLRAVARYAVARDR